MREPPSLHVGPPPDVADPAARLWMDRANQKFVLLDKWLREIAWPKVRDADIDIATIPTGFLAISAGTQSVNDETVVFSNSNGISFGMQGSSLVTASHNALTSQSNQAASASNGSFAFQTLGFSNANGVTFGTSAGSIVTASVAPGGGLTNINLSAGTTSQNLSNFVMSNSNGISFGLNGSTITGSHDGLTSQSNQAASASNGSFAFQTLAFSNANGVTFGSSAGSIITASVAAGAGLTNINVSAGTTSNNLSALVFSNSNDILFGINGSTITASGLFLTSQSNQAASGSNGSFTFQTLSFSNANNVSFGTAAGGNAIVASVGKGASASNGSFAFDTIAFSNANNVTFGTSAGSIITASVAAPGGGAAASGSYYEPAALGGVGVIANGTMSLQRIHVPLQIAATQMDFLMHITGSASGAASFSIVAALYTMSGVTASRASSASRGFTYQSTSANNSYTAHSGTRYRSIGLGTWNMTPGDYLLAFVIATTSASTNSTVTVFINRSSVSVIAASTAGGNYSSYFQCGLLAAATSSAPASIHLSAINYTGSAVHRQPWHQFIGTI